MFKLTHIHVFVVVPFYNKGNNDFDEVYIELIKSSLEEEEEEEGLGRLEQTDIQD